MAVPPPGHTTSRLTLPIVMGSLQVKNEVLGVLAQKSLLLDSLAEAGLNRFFDRELEWYR